MTNKFYLQYLLAMFFFIPVSVEAFGDEDDKKHTKNSDTHHENHFEVELSYNNASHFEFTSSVYFAHLTKFQGTVEFTGHHFAGCFVREIPLGHSKFGTFVGLGSTFGFSHEEDQHSGSVPQTDHEDHLDWSGSLIFQSGIAYSLDRHWSTGFTLSPGVDFETHQPNFGMTFDLVFGF
ncbi:MULTISPECIES: hypothetical protein [Flammeovirga]|nr:MULTISPECIES: hypothetical protein [Flammeovirga]ANQ47700.2 hypothetical protein MY04_0318 [Flammeovirga sp. MY04]